MWGAIVATLVFIWDIYKWRKSGSILRISASPNMQLLYNKITKSTDPKYILIDVSNTGDKKTTMTHLGGVYYQSFWKWLFWRKPDKIFFVPTPAFAKPLPYILEVGEKWSGGVEQTDEIEKWMKTGRFYCGISHSNKSKPQLVRVYYKKAAHNLE